MNKYIKPTIKVISTVSDSYLLSASIVHVGDKQFSIGNKEFPHCSNNGKLNQCIYNKIGWTMEDNLKKYLEWRFRMNNHNKYHKFCYQWISKVTVEQLIYFEKEMVKMIENGIYNC